MFRPVVALRAQKLLIHSIVGWSVVARILLFVGCGTNVIGQPASQPGSQAASQPSSQLASQQASQPASHGKSFQEVFWSQGNFFMVSKAVSEFSSFIQHAGLKSGDLRYLGGGCRPHRTSPTKGKTAGDGCQNWCERRRENWCENRRNSIKQIENKKQRSLYLTR